MSERKGGIILIGIIAFAALGFSGYMFVKNEFIDIPGPTSPDSGLTLVGLWDDFSKNTEYAPDDTNTSWRIEFNNNQFNDSNHISISNNNTSFKLLKEGFYKITLLLLLNDIDANAIYWAYLIRNSTLDNCFDRVAISASPSSPFLQIQSSLYVKSTGFDNFYIICYCMIDTSFAIGTPQTYNQLSIEYSN
ncbi:MAG: hypothetical protein KAW66_02490 [Candidatus Lokiarchaeota archaeon]|nr:hypothetical protein [Candidatus Lokiarchaeota archaeon]